MKYTRKQQEKFLDEELSAISQKYIRTIQKSAIALMEEGEIFVSQFLKIDERGTTILKMRNSRGLPRKGDYFCCVLLIGEMSKYKNWGAISWADLRNKYQKEFSEVVCIWHAKSDNEDFSLVGLKGISLEMSKAIETGCILVLGPQEPPTAYYQNLIQLVRTEEASSEYGKMLDFDENHHEWKPIKLNGISSNATFFSGQWELSHNMIIQGPPGTGKTYKMAELIAKLLDAKKSVIVTALTNRALMELASKEALSSYVNHGLVHKTNVTTDEIKEIPGIVNVEGSELFCSPGNLTLSTFYMSSKWAKEIYELQPFDNLIMDEASQALFAMVCAAKKLAKRAIWIGDQCQLPPVINMSMDRMVEKEYIPLSDGFKTLCDNFNYPSYQLNDTYRLTTRAASFTSLFYDGSLNSVAEKQVPIPLNFLNVEGGPSLIKLPLAVGDQVPSNGIDSVMHVIGEIMKVSSKAEIAVLSKFKSSVKSLQKAFVTRFGESNRVLIDTVERVQGLTCDICIFFIPNDLCYMSLDRALFNVATSRAKMNTIIICDENILNSVSNMSVEVRKFLENVNSEVLSSIDSMKVDEQESQPSPGIKVVGKIDLSQFETPKQKSVRSTTKQNVYIIDTNVFVNCPDIISKIEEKFLVVLSAKVIDELDKLKIKLSNEEKKNVESALRCINRALDKQNVRMELSDMSLLPNDFDKRSPDNNILTVALKFKQDNPILLTSDNGLQVKAKGLNMKTISLKEFLKR